MKVRILPSPRLCEIHTPKKFTAYFLSLTTDNPTISKSQLYELMEVEHHRLYGHRKYKNYHSFQNIIYHQNKRNEQPQP